MPYKEIRERFEEIIKPFKYREIVCLKKPNSKVWKVGRRELSAEEVTSQVKAFELAEAALAKILYDLAKENENGNIQQ